VTLPRPPKAVIFDMDGLLIDSEAVYRDAMLATADAAKLDLPDSVIEQMIGLPWFASAKVLTEHYGEAFDTQAFRIESTRRFHEIGEVGICLKAGVIELLDHLDALTLPRAICTSSAPDQVDHHIGGHGLLARFDAIVARGDYVNSKPAPDPFLVAAARLGVDPADCLALEDSHNGVRAASSAGMMTVMVPDLLTATDEMRGLCVRVAASLHEVRVWLDA
jgi:HAD superfamily hydrolase (TIGR01509 family)